MGFGVGRVRTRMRPCLLGAETAEQEAEEKEDEDEEMEGLFDEFVVVVMDLSQMWLKLMEAYLLFFAIHWFAERF